MINWFILKVEEVGNEEYFHRNLDLSTLKYIFKLDPFKVINEGYLVRKTLNIFVVLLLGRQKIRSKRFLLKVFLKVLRMLNSL